MYSTYNTSILKGMVGTGTGTQTCTSISTRDVDATPKRRQIWRNALNIELEVLLMMVMSLFREEYPQIVLI